jgi:hypothetical protein
MDHEVRNMRDATGEITGVLRHDHTTQCKLEKLGHNMDNADSCHNALVKVFKDLSSQVNGLITRVATTEHGLALAQTRIAELEAQPKLLLESLIGA